MLGQVDAEQSSDRNHWQRKTDENMGESDKD